MQRSPFTGTRALKVLVTSFADQSTPPGFEEGLTSAIKTVLRQYWVTLLDASEQQIEHRPAEIEAVYVACKVESHAAAEEIGRTWRADAVLWGTVHNKADAVTQELAQVFQRSVISANNASRNTIQAGVNAKIQIDSQQTINLQLPSELAGLSLQTSMTLVRARGLVNDGARNLFVSDAPGPTELDFPVLGSQWPLALFHVLLGVYATRELRFGLAAQQLEEAQQQLATRALPELQWLIGANRMLAGRHPGGMAALEQALKLCPDAARRCQASALTHLGWGYRQQGELRKAIEAYQQAQLLFQTDGTSEGLVDVFAQLGRTYDELGQAEPAAQNYLQAAALIDKISSPGARVRARLGLGLFQSRRGQLRDAMSSYNQALALAKGSLDEIGQVGILNNQGVAYEAQHRLEAARDAYTEAIRISEQLGGGPAEATVQANLGRSLIALQDQKAAERAFASSEVLYQHSLSQQGLLRDLRGQIRSFCLLSTAYGEWGKKTEAVNAANQALFLSRQIGDRSAQAAALMLSARGYAAMSELQKARDLAAGGLALSSEKDSAPLQILQYQDLGDYQAAAGNWSEALAAYQQVLSLVRRTGHLAQQTKVVEAMARLPQANLLNLQQQLVQLARQRGDVSAEVSAAFSSAHLQARLGNTSAAGELCQSAMDLAEQSGDPRALRVAVAGMARQCLFAGDKKLALKSYERLRDMTLEPKNAERAAALLSTIGSLRCVLAQGREGLDELQQARELGQSLGAPWERALLRSEAACWQARGDNKQAKAKLLQSRELSQPPLPGDLDEQGASVSQPALPPRWPGAEYDAQTLSVPWSVSRLAELGDVYFRAAQFEQAELFYQDSLSLSQQLGQLEQEAETHDRLARLYAARYEPARARSEQQLAITFYEKTGDTPRALSLLFALSALYLSHGHPGDAENYHGRAGALAASTRKYRVQADASVKLGQLASARAEYRIATRYYDKAIELYENLGDKARKKFVEELLAAIPLLYKYPLDRISPPQSEE